LCQATPFYTQPARLKLTPSFHYDSFFQILLFLYFG